MRRPSYSLVVIMSLTFASCSDVAIDGPKSPSGSPIDSRAFNARPNDSARYLPYGVPVPQGEIVRLMPEPYNQARHGLGLPNSDPSRGPYPLRVRRSGVAQTGHVQPVDGAQMLNSSEGAVFVPDSVQGFQAVSDIQLDVALPGGGSDTTVLYAPTYLPSSRSCIEVSTIHERYPGEGSTKHYFGLWDWCGEENFRVKEEMTSSWRSKYVRAIETAYGEPAEDGYLMVVQQYAVSPNCWETLIFNYSAGQWERKSSYVDQSGYHKGWCGTSAISAIGYGWTMWELETSTSGCPTLPSIRARQVYAYVYNWGLEWFQPDYLMESTIVHHHRTGCFNGTYTFAEQWNLGPQGENGTMHSWRVYAPNQ